MGGGEHLELAKCISKSNQVIQKATAALTVTQVDAVCANDPGKLRSKLLQGA